MLNKYSNSLYDFAKDFIEIKDGDSTRKFNEFELDQLSLIQKNIDDGYHLRLISFRSGSKICLFKNK